MDSKRDVEACGVEATTQKCESSKKPNGIMLEDGTEFLFEGMDDGLIDELVDLAENGTIATNIPEVFKHFQRYK